MRRFIEQGPEALPPVKTHLVWRPRGLRPFVDILGISQSMMREYPSLPAHRRKPGWLIFGVGLLAIASPVFLLVFQIPQGIAVKFTTRLPKWPQEYEALAATGGPMRPPAGSQPNDPPLLPHERVITGIWVGTALTVYALIAWAAFG